jgi:hypothetical protein
MYPIWKYGNEEQRMKYLPKLATGEWIGCFGLTEPDFGSNPGGMVTNFKDMGDHYLLNGAKMWISNAPFADIAVVWAKNEEGRIHGLIVERGMEGFSTPETHNKWSLRASATGELIFDNVKVPKENLLPNKSGLGAPLGCLDSARYGIAWGAIGAAMDCYDTALRYSKERIQFDKPIGATQLQQKKLAEMITEITKAQLLTWRLGVLRNEGRATSAQISMAKKNSVKDENIMLGAGSTEILDLVAKFVSIGKGNYVIAEPSYDYWTVTLDNFGLTKNKVPLTTDKKINLQAMLEAVNQDTKLIYICNPNNPTGTICEREALVECVTKISQNTIVLIDEAYLDFTKQQSLSNIVNDHKNIIIVKTFSKIYGLAGARIGYAIANKTIDFTKYNCVN